MICPCLLEEDNLDILIWIILVLIASVIWISVFDSNRFTVSHYEFTDARIRKPVKVVFLSDLHCKMFGYGGTFLIEKIKEINPDLILMGGDMITAYPGHKEDNTVNFIKALYDLFPIVYAFGNHELRLKIYPEEYGDTWKRYTEKLGKFGLKITENGKWELEGSGVDIISFSAERKYYKRFEKMTMEPAYIRETAGEADPSKFSILLAHNPEYFGAYSEYGADLTLSGHVHGGIMRIPFPAMGRNSSGSKIVMRGVISPGLKLFPKYDSGRFDENGKSMIVSRGLGTHTIPVRIFNPGDLVVIDLKPENGV